MFFTLILLMRFFWLIFSFAFFCFPAFSQNKTADLVIINAKIRTMDKNQPQAEALAVNGSKISFVGTNRQIRPLIDTSTKTIDAKGRLVLPGFNDSHVHFSGIGNLFSTIDLRGAKSPQEVVEKIEYFVKFLPKGRWILGGYWNNENWTPSDLPTKELIDKAAPDNPVFIYNSNPKTALANSLALKLAKIDKNQKDIAGGEILRDRNDEPTGILKGSAIKLVSSVIPKLHNQNWAEVIETASNYAASFGVTSVQDVHSDNLIEIYRQLERDGKLKTRVYECTRLSDWKKLADAGIQKASGNGMIRGGCLKHFSDGDFEYLPTLSEQVLAADRANLQVMIHAIGRNANEIVLTVFENVLNKNDLKDRRFRVEHAHNFRAEDLQRFGKSKIIASMQPHLFYGNEPYRNLMDSGTVLAFGSDASITDFNPLLGIYAAVKRGLSSNDDQGISIEEAVRAYTLGSAYAEFQENVKGTITVGKLADFIILSDDIFSINSNDIRKVKVLTTVMDGKIVYEAK